MENMVEVGPPTQWSRSVYCNKRMMSESNLKMQCQSIEAKVRQICGTAEVTPNSFSCPSVVQC